MKIKNILFLYSAVLPVIFGFVTAFNKALLYLGFPIEIRIMSTIVFCIAFYISSDRTVPYILNFSFYQWSLYYFLRLDNYRLKNYMTAFICGIYPPTIPLWIFYLLIIYGLSEPTYYEYSWVVAFLWTMFRLFSIMAAYFMNPQIEGFQFIGENQKLDDITWENFINSMSIVCMHYFKKPIKNSIDSSRSKYALPYIAKRSMYRWVLTKSVETLKTYHDPITTVTAIVVAGAAVCGLSINSGGNAEAAQINANSQERIAKINADVEIAKLKDKAEERGLKMAEIQRDLSRINAQVDIAKIQRETAKLSLEETKIKLFPPQESYPWWWFKRGTPKPENTSFESVSKGISRMVEED